VTWNNVPGDWMEPGSAWADRALTELARSSWSVLVLHDQHVAAMMDTLEWFHAATVQMGVEIAQDFPRDCVPILEGEIRGSVENLVALDGTGGLVSSISTGDRP
jgi:hypothetical protein